MPDFFEEVKAAVVDDAALSQGDTSRRSCSVSRELSPGPQPWGGTAGSSPPSPTAVLRTLCLVARGPGPGRSIRLPAVSPLPSLPTPVSPSVPAPCFYSLCVHLSLPAPSLHTWAPCLAPPFAPGLPAWPLPPHSHLLSVLQHLPPLLPMPLLNTCRLTGQTVQIASDPAWLPNHFVSETLYPQPGRLPKAGVSTNPTHVHDSSLHVAGPGPPTAPAAPSPPTPRSPALGRPA